MNSFTQRHEKLIELSGGIVEENKYVSQSAVVLKSYTKLSEEFLEIIKNMNISQEQEEYLQNAEFCGRITYLSFLDNQVSTPETFPKKMIELGHLSVFNDIEVSFLIAGVSIETMLEFVAHNEGKIARLTSSKTDAQNECLYNINLKEEKEFLSNLEKNKDKMKEILSNERINMLSSGTKAVSFTISMSLKDWHKTLIGRLSKNGVETEMLEVCEKIAKKLKEKYPILILDIEDYYVLNNAKKYHSD